MPQIPPKTLSDVLQQYLTTSEMSVYDFILIWKKTLGFGTTNPCTLGSILRQMPADILVSAEIYSSHFSTQIFEKRVNNSELSDELIVSTYKYLIHSYYSNQSSLPFYGVFPIYPCAICIQIYSENQAEALTLVFLDDRAYQEYVDLCTSRRALSETEKKERLFKEQVSHDSENPLRKLLSSCIDHSLFFEDTKSATVVGEVDIPSHDTYITDASGRAINDVLKRSLLRSLSGSEKRSRGRLGPPFPGGDICGDERDETSVSSVLFDENSAAAEEETILVLQSLADPEPFLENMGCHVQMGAEALGILVNEIGAKFRDDIREDEMSLLTDGDVRDGNVLLAERNRLDVENSCTEANFPNTLPIVLPGVSRAVCSLNLIAGDYQNGRSNMTAGCHGETPPPSPAAQYVEIVTSPFAQVWLNGRPLPASVPCMVKVGDVLIFGSLRYTFRLRRVNKSEVVRILPALSTGSREPGGLAHYHHSNAVILRTEFSFSDRGAIRSAAARVLVHTRLAKDSSQSNHLWINPFVRHQVSGSFEETLLQIKPLARTPSVEEEVEGGYGCGDQVSDDPLLRIFLEELKSWFFWLGCKIRINIVKNVTLTKTKRGQQRRKQTDILTFTGYISTKRLASVTKMEGEDKFVFQHRCINEKGEIMQLVQRFAVYGVKCARTIAYLTHQGEVAGSSFARALYDLSDSSVVSGTYDEILSRVAALNAPGIMAKLLVSLHKPRMDKFDWIRICADTLLQHEMVPYEVMNWYVFGKEYEFRELFSAQLAALWINRMDMTNRLVIVELTLHCCILLRLAVDCFKQSSRVTSMPSFNDMFSWMYRSCYNNSTDDDFRIPERRKCQEPIETYGSYELKLVLVRRTIEYWQRKGEKMAVAKNFMSWKWVTIFLRTQADKDAKRADEDANRRTLAAAGASTPTTSPGAGRVRRMSNLLGMTDGVEEDYMPLLLKNKRTLKSLYAYYARITVGTLTVNGEEDGQSEHLPMERMWGLLKDFEVSPIFCSMNALKVMRDEHHVSSQSTLSLNGFVKVLISIAELSMLVKGRENKLGALFRIMNRSKGRGKVDMGLPALAETAALPSSPSNKRRKRASDCDIEYDIKADSTSISKNGDAVSMVPDEKPETEVPSDDTFSRRRPSLPAPAAAQDLQSSVTRFLDSMDVFSPAVDTPKPTVERRLSVDASTETDLLYTEEYIMQRTETGQAVRRLSRRPSLTAPVAADNIHSTVMSFVESMSVYSPSTETPHATRETATSVPNDGKLAVIPDPLQRAPHAIASRLSLEEKFISVDVDMTASLGQDKESSTTESVVRRNSRQPFLAAPMAGHQPSSVKSSVKSISSSHSPSLGPHLSPVSKRSVCVEAALENGSQVSHHPDPIVDDDEEVSVLSEGSWHQSTAGRLFPMASPSCSTDEAAAHPNEEFGSLVPLVAHASSSTTSFETAEYVGGDGDTTIPWGGSQSKGRRKSGDSQYSAQSARSYVYASRYPNSVDKTIARKSIKATGVPPKVVTQNMTSIRSIIRQAVQKAGTSPSNTASHKTPENYM